MFIDRLDEEFLLFAMDGNGQFAQPHKGSVDSGIAGAWLAEMVLHNRVRLEADKVVHRGHSDFGEPVLDSMLQTVWSVRRPKPVRAWVDRFARQAPRRRPEVLQRLAERGYLERVGDGRSTRYVTHGDGRAMLRAQLLETLHGRRAPDESTVALIALLDAAGLMGHVFGAREAEPLHRQAQLLLRRYRSLSLIAESVRAKKPWWQFSWGSTAKPVAQAPVAVVKGKSMGKAMPATGPRSGFDPKTGGRRLE